jgi:hypothetical protein
MTLAELNEAVADLGVMLKALAGVLVGAEGTDAANLYFAIGDLSANADSYLRTASLGAPLLNVFDLAFAAGATIGTLETVRTELTALTPTGLPAIAVVNAGIRMALAEEVKVLAATEFTSSQDVQAALAQINDGFDSAIEYAADNRDPTCYQALIAAHAAAVRDLTTRALSLPSIITYAFGRVMTSHALANRLYGDASRCDELRLENKIIDPHFMGITGTALSE